MEVIEQIISEPQMAILNSTADINLFLAGTGSGKTHLGGVLSANFITQFPEVRGAIFANTFDQLNTSSLFRIREYWQSIGITEWSKENPTGTYTSGKEPPQSWIKCKRNFDRFNNIISFCNGGLIFTGSLDNYFAHSGKEFGWALLDETKDSKEEAIKEVIITRLRQPGMYKQDGRIVKAGQISQQWNPLYCLTSPARVDWINEMFELDSFVDEIAAKIYSDTTFFEKEFNNKKVVISSSYHNAHNVGLNYINNILANNTEERGRALVYGNPFSVTGGEFYSSFNRLKHVVSVKYEESVPLHLSFDQNTVPYNSCSIWQVKKVADLWVANCIDEIALENPRNSTEEVCEEFMLRYPRHNSGLYYYGDASGKNRSTMNKDFKHHYEIVAFKLRKYLNNGSDRTLFSNPSLVKRRDFINLIFEEKLPIRITIDESCRKMIADLMYTKQALDGGKDKHIVTDKDSGEKYQKYGHFGDNCFVAETLITTDHGDLPIIDIKVGDMVLTRNGYKRVTDKKSVGLKEVRKYKIGGRKITCTPDHRIFATDSFIMVDSLINANILAIFVEKRSWIDKLLFSMGINSIDTQKQKTNQTKDTIEAGYVNPVSGERLISTDISGSVRTGRLKKVLQFIILTVILKIIQFRIIGLSLFQITLHIITKYLRRITRMPILTNFLDWLYLRPKHGIGQRKVESGILSSSNKLYSERNRREFVLSAIRSLKQTLENSRNTVMSSAREEELQDSPESQGNTMKTGSVSYAGDYFRLTSTAKIASALVSVRRIDKSNKQKFVFDITVDEEHEFFANGILVHNCEYLCVELFKNYYNG